MKNVVVLISICFFCFGALGQTVSELVEDVSATNLERHVLEMEGPRWTEAQMLATANYISSEFTSYGLPVTT